MNKKFLLYIIVALIFLMPIISIEGAIPWVVSLFFINKCIKEFKLNTKLNALSLNVLYCGIVILSYNIIARYIESIMIRAWM
ncbi:MAG: hypothetical protein ACRC68_11400 [Clostridium sp.]